MAASLRKLQTLLEFTDTDLNANRRGRLSKAQIEDLKATSTNELKAVLIIPIVIVLWMVMFVDLKVALPAIIIIGLIGTGIVALHRDHLKTYRDRKVRKLKGQLRKNPDSSEYGLAQYIVSIDNEQLPVDRHLFEALPEGKFTVYLLEKEQQILCMEPLRSSTASTKSTSTARKSTARSTTKKASTSKTSTAKKRRTTQSTSKKSASTTKAKSQKTSKSSRTKSASATTTKKSTASSRRKPTPTRKPTSSPPKKSTTTSPNRSSSPSRRPTTHTASTTRTVAKPAKPKGVVRPMQWTRTRETSDH
jgi:hypothetical protein